jgi:hypothetical protein
MLNSILWFPIHILLAHYVLMVNMTTPRGRIDEADARCEQMYQRLFGKKLQK